MNRQFKIQKLKDQSGFTLIEMLVVVIILGILAMIIIPQISVSTEDAKTNTLSTNLGSLRGAVELYYHQHNSIYPGARLNDGSGTVTTAAEAQTAFEEQLVQYTDVNGDANPTKTATHKYGPYLKAGVLPMNPFNDLATVVCDIANADVTVRTSAGDSAGWKFYTVTGILISGDNGAHDTL